MARNGSGTYSLPAGNPVVTGTAISSTVQNTTMSDIATALTQSISADGQTPITANIPMGAFKLTGLAAGTTAGDSVRYEQFASPPAIGGTTPAAGAFTTISATGQVTSTVATGTPPLVVASTTAVANLTATNQSGGTVAATTISASGQITSTIATGTAPLVVASTTLVANLHAATADSISGGAVAATTISASSTSTLADVTATSIVSSNIDGTTYLTPIAFNSATTVDFTVPTTARKIRIAFVGTAFSGTSVRLIQIGGASIESTGYVSHAQNFGNTAIASAYTTVGFILEQQTAGGEGLNGGYDLYLMDSTTNLWKLEGSAGITGITASKHASGIKAITGAIQKVRITTAGGTDTNTAGTIYVSYE